MKKEILKTIIKDFQKDSLPEIVEREISIPLDSNKIISIIGARRSGKTYIIFQLIKTLLNKGVPDKNILYINFEDERLDLGVNELDLIIQAYMELYPEINLKDCFIFFY